MSNGDVGKVSLQDIQLVQNLIERCLQLYMSQREVMSTLLHQAKIEPGFTELVWQKLEAENQEFFRAYHLRLIVKDQILRFNQLLERQVELMHQLTHTGVVPVPLSNGSQIHSMHNNSAFQAPQPAGPSVKPENMDQAIGAMPNVYTNGASSFQPCMQVGGNMGGHAGRVEAPMNMLLAQSSKTGMMHGLYGVTIKTEGCYADDSPIMFGPDNNLLEPRNAIGEASISPLNGGASSSQVLNETMLDQEANSFGFLEQIPRNLSLSDLTADFSNSADILESYSRSPFLGTDANFWDPHIRGEQQDIRRLDTISEGFSYEDFGSD
ncbi:Angiotensin-converting enzyme 2 [Handroanthus impetiginosus]|uniref:Angiotensin-converting enzyme 2 n=1 Tax=Handroanthus impetiginosus TaxID=429701 RepID=A0A2G9HLB5_9LAMI|nr:Angiotensin-converting enzyme 2 [Handroanthus impetiginosus]